MTNAWDFVPPYLLPADAEQRAALYRQRGPRLSVVEVDTEYAQREVKRVNNDTEAE